MKDLGTLGGVNSEAYDINTSGQISGYADTAGDQRAFRYSGGVMTDIGALLGNTLPNSYGYSINDAGHVAGTAYNRNYTMWHAFLYNGSQAVTIERPDNKGSSALSINNRGSIAGYLVLTSDVEHAFFYSGGVITDLGTLGGNYSYGIGLNNSNVVVGGSFVDTNESVYHAFLWAGNSMKDLNDLLDASGSGWVLTEARSINDSGQIVGVGRRGGVNRAFLLNPVPKITRLNTSGTNVLVSFTSINTAPYVLESRDDVAKGSWSNTVTGLSGNGGTLTATNRGAARLRQRFYRAKLLTP
jgi:probable HAF family extracellular repeat protein